MTDHPSVYFVGEVADAPEGFALCDTVEALPTDVVQFLARDAQGRLALHHVAQLHPPLSIDFHAPYYRHRGGTEYLPKAFRGMSGGVIVDVTAGWGRDAWLLAYRGFQVRLFERHPFLAAMLSEAVLQARADAEIGTVADRLSFIGGDALAVVLPEADAAYLDPMFPERRKSAKVKKQMQALHTLLGGAQDDEDMLLARMRQRYARVVVKRPQGAPFVGGAKPSHSLSSPNTRYDVYLR